MAELRDYVAGLSPREATEYQAVHEALAWALDAERFLGSFHRGGSGGFRAEHVDSVADHLLVWLAERGCTVVRDTPHSHDADDANSATDLVLALDPASGMLLDGRTARYYELLDAEDVGFEEPLPDTDLDAEIALNTMAAAWCAGLRLSDASGYPPSGHAGQYGRHGCVLVETAASETTIVHDVCLVPYDDAALDRFLDELSGAAHVAFVASPVTVRDITERRNGLHPLSRYAHRSTLDRDLSQVARRTDIAAVLAWGRRQAERMTEPD